MKLKAYLEKTGTDLDAFALAIGVSTASVYRYMSGDRVPKQPIMRAIVAETEGGVMPNDFLGEQK